MPKYDTVIKYINNGSVISESVLTIPLEDITQEKINIGMELILRIHNQEPVNAHVKIMQGKRTLKKFDYFMLCEEDENDKHFVEFKKKLFNQ
jgi:hypothetical protein